MADKKVTYQDGVVGAANHVGKREVLAPGPRD
jgi:DNA segregation ATPase FtsK/SpoIIIE-like protein